MSDLVVLVPTRSRPHNVSGIVEAWHKTGAFDVAELYFVFDLDDMAAAEYNSIIRNLPGANMVCLPDWQPLVPKLNRAASEFSESHKAVAFMGDDHLPRTEMWAHYLIEDHFATPGGRKVVYGRDGFQDQRLPTWWSMDSKIIEALGGKMVPADVQHLYCDNAVKELGERAGCLLYDERILIEHMHPVVGKAPMDAQYERVNRRQQYDADQAMFRRWLAYRADEDATLVRNAGG